jgi:hypothetical protein
MNKREFVNYMTLEYDKIDRLSQDDEESRSIDTPVFRLVQLCNHPLERIRYAATNTLKKVKGVQQ